MPQAIFSAVFWQTRRPFVLKISKWTHLGAFDEGKEIRMQATVFCHKSQKED